MKTLHLLIIAMLGVTMSILIQFPFVSSDSGSLIGFDARSPDLSNMSLVLYDKFDQVSPNSTKDLYLEFFDEKNKTLVKNVSFFVNATKGDTVLIHELFYTRTGIMTLKFSPGSDTGKYVINGTAEPVLGGMMSNNDILPIEMSAFTPGTYHFHIEVLALVYTNGISDQTHPPTFDSWWSVDNKGNISKYENSTTVSKIKNASPLQQFKSGVAADDVKCVQGFQLVIKSEDGSPACARPQTAQKLVERGWTKQESYYVDPHMSPKVSLYDYFYDGIDKDNTTVSINNRAYYQTTLNYTVDNLRKDTSTQFHGVTFDFPDGIVNTPGGNMTILDVTFSDGYEETYGKKIMNQDGSGSGSGIAIPSKFGPPAITSITVLSNHALPQAGITIYHDKIKLLVSK